MEKLNFQTGEIIGQAWRIFKEKWTQIFGILALYSVLSGVASGLVSALQGNSDLAGLAVVVSLASQVFTLFLSIGLIKLMLAVVRGEQINFTELFGGAKYMLQYFLGAMVVGLIEMVGMLLFIIPGIIWSLKYMFTLYLIVDEGMDYSTAMKESEKMTNGIKWQLVGFGFALFGLNLLGMLALVIGLIVTMPVSALASYVLYNHLRSQMKVGQPAMAAVSPQPMVVAPAEGVAPAMAAPVSIAEQPIAQPAAPAQPVAEVQPPVTAMPQPPATPTI